MLPLAVASTCNIGYFQIKLRRSDASIYLQPISDIMNQFFRFYPPVTSP